MRLQTKDSIELLVTMLPCNPIKGSMNIRPMVQQFYFYKTIYLDVVIIYKS